MITLEQIRLLEGKITRAIELIRVLKEENTTLRRGLESAQKRMKELETLVDGFKTDQREIETVIVRTLHNLDELEETAATPKRSEQDGRTHADARAARQKPAEERAAEDSSARQPSPPPGLDQPAAKEELDIF
ncbi:MAG TPA: hypothetical protein VMV03_02825 [Spirochaetia bacterium]|nr:hypothetical protein [Spirochaetia bacterium]